MKRKYSTLYPWFSLEWNSVPFQASFHRAQGDGSWAACALGEPSNRDRERWMWGCGRLSQWRQEAPFRSSPPEEVCQSKKKRSLSVYSAFVLAAYPHSSVIKLAAVLCVMVQLWHRYFRISYLFKKRELALVCAGKLGVLWVVFYASCHEGEVLAGEDLINVWWRKQAVHWFIMAPLYWTAGRACDHLRRYNVLYTLNSEPAYRV